MTPRLTVRHSSTKRLTALWTAYMHPVSTYLAVAFSASQSTLDASNCALVLGFYLSELMQTNYPWLSIMGSSGLTITIMESGCGASVDYQHCIAFQGIAYSRC
jgi:hypothetical protein